MQWIDLKDNEIGSIPNLNKYAELEVLEISGNKISKISATAFRKLTKLKYLDLSNNSFTHWSQINAREILSSAIKLTTLKLSHNSLKTFTTAEDKSFVKSSSLEELHLKSCDIEHFDGKSLDYFTRLQHLDLSYNPIGWLKDLSSKTLMYLDVSHCKLDSMSPYALIKLPSITTLKISGNAQFDMSFGNLTSGSLQSFEASHCSLTSPGLYSLPNLTYANLQGNNIEVLKERSFSRNKLLVELDLSSNDIKEIHPQAFIGARQITFVNLSTNSLTNTIPWNAFSTNYNLKVLDLSGNRIETLGNLSILELEYLDVSHCSIKAIHKDCLTGLPWLKHLNLSHNPLEKIPDDIQSWFLRSIDLSYCRLSILTNNTFRRFPEIGTIYLTGNRFTKPFKNDMFYYNERLESLELVDNPWICNCSSQEFKEFWDFLTSFPAKIKSSDEKDIKCMSPDTVAGKSWMSACYLEWFPPVEPESISFGLTHYGSVLLILFIVTIGVFAVLLAIKHGIKRRMKQEQEEMARELSQLEQERHSMVMYERRQTFPFIETEETELMARPPVRARTESELMQPPTYEEAIQMSASREDMVSREDVEAGASGQQEDNDDEDDSEDGQSYSIGSEISDSGEDDDNHEPKHVSRRKV